MFGLPDDCRDGGEELRVCCGYDEAGGDGGRMNED